MKNPIESLVHTQADSLFGANFGFSPSGPKSKLLMDVEQVVKVTKRTLGENADLIRAAWSKGPHLQDYLRDVAHMFATNHSQLNYINGVATKIRQTQYVYPEDHCWVNDIFSTADWLGALAADERLIELFTLRGFCPVTSPENRSTDPLEQLRSKKVELYQRDKDLGYPSVKNGIKLLEILKQSINEGKGSRSKTVKKGIADNWCKLLTVYVSIKNNVARAKLERFLWVMDPNSDVNNTPSLEEGTLDLLEDIEILMYATGELPAVVIEHFRSLIK